MEFLIHQYTQNLINNFKSGGIAVQAPQVNNKPKNDEPAVEPVVESVDDGDEPEMFDLFG